MNIVDYIEMQYNSEINYCDEEQFEKLFLLFEASRDISKYETKIQSQTSIEILISLLLQLESQGLNAIQVFNELTDTNILQILRKIEVKRKDSIDNDIFKLALTSFISTKLYQEISFHKLLSVIREIGIYNLSYFYRQPSFSLKEVYDSYPPYKNTQLPTEYVIRSIINSVHLYKHLSLSKPILINDYRINQARYKQIVNWFSQKNINEVGISYEIDNVTNKTILFRNKLNEGTFILVFMIDYYHEYRQIIEQNSLYKNKFSEIYFLTSQKIINVLKDKNLIFNDYGYLSFEDEKLIVVQSCFYKSLSSKDYQEIQFCTKTKKIVILN